jgi:hypothetical protein
MLEAEAPAERAAVLASTRPAPPDARRVHHLETSVAVAAEAVHDAVPHELTPTEQLVDHSIDRAWAVPLCSDGANWYAATPTVIEAHLLRPLGCLRPGQPALRPARPGAPLSLHAPACRGQRPRSRPSAEHDGRANGSRHLRCAPRPEAPWTVSTTAQRAANATRWFPAIIATSPSFWRSRCLLVAFPRARGGARSRWPGVASWSSSRRAGRCVPPAKRSASAARSPTSGRTAPRSG